MGVPALFRWLSKKYPKIVGQVQEEEPRTVPGKDGADDEELPIDMSGPNPNGEEFDCLYLDMNGIVHPCTHPEGKPPPETEEEMMKEVFLYTERVVNMVRPRRLLMMAIDGVAPRAKMNQQRSRRFRSAQEAKEKQEEREKALAEWKASGLPVTDEAKENKKAWDSNAITPGTPFMDLLAASLRYWVAQKLNQDAGWRNLQVIISDASVPGEGEHKIMDHIRRQRSHPEHDPNTKHVIYGLDADLIMLSLATHEPYFKVLREDVFAQDQKSTRGCHRCGQEGHIAANCIGEPKPSLANTMRAIDDWVFLIFFVGNDFLPHLPSLEIREGAIDTLLKIWKAELPRMGGYLTKHGKVELKNAQLILEGIAGQEDDIFRRRKEQEERQEANAKRRKLEDEERQRRSSGFKHGESDYSSSRAPPKANGSEQEELKRQAIAALESGRSEDIISNQKAIRMANLSAAEKLKAELKGNAARSALSNGKGAKRAKVEADEEASKVTAASASAKKADDGSSKDAGEDDIGPKPKVQNGDVETTKETDEQETMNAEPPTKTPDGLNVVDGKEEDVEANGDASMESAKGGKKRTIDDVDGEDEGTDVGEEEAPGEEDDEGNETVDPIEATNIERKVNPDGTVDYEDTVKLWEPGYRERYYQQKFGVELSDTKFRRGVVKAYMEGLSWVLAYYYQGCPSWTWYYPYHFSPFAADFTDLATLDITFDQGKPFRPFDQLMGVLPAASRASIPPVLHPLMTESDSEIIDFYPETFSIDMNGKKMAWQGVALLPFIDEKRLLQAIESKYDQLTEDEVRRNSFGDHTLFVSEDNQLYNELCVLYVKRKGASKSDDEEAVRMPLNAALSGGITGIVRADPDCVPGSTFNTPFMQQPEDAELADITNDRSLSVLYEFPAQKTPHKSVLLKGVKLPKRVLNEEDKEWTRRGGPSNRGGSRGRGGPPRGVARGGAATAYGGHYDSGAMRMGNGPMAHRSHQGPAVHHRWDEQGYGSGGGGGGAYGGSYGGRQYGAYPPSNAGGPPPQRHPDPYSRYPPQPAGYDSYGNGAGGEAYGGYGGYGGPPSQYGPPSGGGGGLQDFGSQHGGGRQDPYASSYGGSSYQGGAGGYGGGAYGGGGYGGGSARDGYGGAGGPSPHAGARAGYGGQFGGGASQAQPSGGYGGASYGGGAYNGGGGGGGYGAAPPAGGYGGGAYGGGAGGGYGGGAYGAPPPSTTSSAPPRPLGFRTGPQSGGGAPRGGNARGGGGGGGGAYGGGPYGRY
ncbi:hypothetical protein L7F22_040464 [Adiantum nelumboides]|nr:hypothetical protein [Adiantum nelumboides]